MKLLILIGILLLLLAAVLIIRTARCKASARKLTEKKDESTPEQKRFYAERLAEMIRCATVSSKEAYDDTEFSKLRDVVARLFPLIEKTAEKRVFSDDCWVYKIAGRDETRNVMLMSHHDVAPVKEGWKYPAFSGEIAEERIWGRGTVDTKTPLFAEFSALEELLEEGVIPACTVWIASSHNEEIAGDGIPLAVKYFEEQGTKFDWILDEGGAVIDAPMGGISCKCAMLAVHEKGRRTLEITAAKDSGHEGLAASTKTPVTRMAAFITEIGERQPFIRRMHPELKAMFDGLAPYMTVPLRLVFANMWLFSGLLKKLIPAINSQAGAMLGTSCTFKDLESDEDGTCRAKAFLRCVKEDDLAQDMETLLKSANKHALTVSDVPDENEYHRPASLYSSGFSYIKAHVEKSFPYAACAPFILPAGTDARHFSALCDTVIRFAPIDIDNQQYGSVHNTDENISLDAVVRAVAFYRDLIKGYTL